jgi:hypothetical protein
MLNDCDPSRLNSAFETLDAITSALPPLEVIISGVDASLHLMYHNAFQYDFGLRTEDARIERAHLYECFRRSVSIQRLSHAKFTERALPFQELVYLSSGRFKLRNDKLNPPGPFDDIRKVAKRLITSLAGNYNADAKVMNAEIRQISTDDQQTVLRLGPLPGSHRANAARSRENDTCNECGGRGHWSDECPSRSNKKKGQNGNSHNAKKGKGKSKKGSSGESSKGKEPGASA